MSIQQLAKIEGEASHDSGMSDRQERAKSLLAKMRNGPNSLSDAINGAFRGWHSGSDAVAKSEVFAVIDEMASDIYRIAEMRLAAKARFHKVSAAQKRAIITASILPIPELEEEQVLWSHN